jgi:hypothetical protein
MTQAGGNRNVDVLVCVVRVLTWQQPDRQPTRRPGTSGRVLHHAGEPSADEDGVALRDAAAQLEGQIGE